jgi:hypothetical protein
MLKTQTIRGRKNLRAHSRGLHRNQARPSVELLEDRTVPSTFTWNNASGGDWDTPGNWLVNGQANGSNLLPGANDTAVINLGSNNFAVTHASGVTDTVYSLTCAANLSLSAGTLAIANSTTVGGSITAVAGTGLQFGGATAFTGSSQLTSDGSVEFDGNASVQGTFSVGPDGTTIIGYAAVADFAGTVTGVGSSLVTQGADADFHNTPLTLAHLTIGYAFQGVNDCFLRAGDITITNGFGWTGGTITGPGTHLTIAAGASMSLSSGNQASGTFWDVDGRTLDNYGTVTLVGYYGHYLRLSGGSVVNNLGTFQTEASPGNAGISGSSTGEVFNNDGAFTQTGSQQTTIQVPFNNSGTVTVASGALALYGNVASSGSITVSPGAGTYYQGNGGTTSSDSGPITAASGTTVVFDGQVNISGAVNADTVVFFNGVNGVNLAGATDQVAALYQANVTKVAGGRPVVFSGPFQNATSLSVAQIPGSAIGGGSVTCTGAVSSLGAVYLADGALDLSQATLATAARNLPGLVIDGSLHNTAGLVANGAFTVAAPFVLGNGSLVSPNNSGTITASAGMRLNAQSYYALNGFVRGFTLINPAGQTAQVTGQDSLDSASQFINHGTLELSAAAGTGAGLQYDQQGSTAQVSSDGAIVADGPGTDYLYLNVASSGPITVNPSAGTYYQGNGGTTSSDSGPITAAAGTTVVFDGQVDISGAVNADTVVFYNSVNGVNLAGATDQVAAPYQANVTKVAGGRPVVFSGPFQNATSLSVAQIPGSAIGGGSVTCTGAVSSLGAVYLADGALDLSQATLAAAARNLSGLDIDGSPFNPNGLVAKGAFTVAAPFVLGNGSLVSPDGSGSLTALAGMRLVGPPFYAANGRIDGFELVNPVGQTAQIIGDYSLRSGASFVNAGDALWISGGLSFFDTSSFTNTVTGVFNDEIDGSFGSADGLCQDFNNQGTFIKSGGTGISDLQMQLNNSGTVNVEQGTLVLGCGYAQGSGGSISGNVSGPITNPGTYNSGPSTNPPVLSNYTQTATGTLYEQIGGLTAGSQYGQIIVTGNVNLAGYLQVALINGFTPAYGNQFTIIDNQGSNPINGTFTNLPEGTTVWDTTHTYRFTVSYVGSDVAGDNRDLVLTAQQTATNTAVTASANPSVLNQPITFTATITPAIPINLTPTGSVQFRIDNVNFGNPVALTTAGTATSDPTAALAAGTHTITAIYSGDGSFLASTGSLTQAVHYNFSGFLAPLNKTMPAGSLGKQIPIKFQLKDVTGNPVSFATMAAALSAVTSLQVQLVDSSGNPLAAPFTPASNTGLTYDPTAQQFTFSWQTKVLSAGYYNILLALNDGTVQTKIIQLIPTGKSAGLTTTAAGGSGSTSTNALLAGDITLYVDNTNGDLTADELARIQDAVTAADAVTEPYGVAVTEVTDPTLADVTLNMDTTSAVGGYADGVLGCTTDAGQITIINGWNFYAGSDAMGIGTAQHDFETVVEHELGHVLGLGHSTDSTSVMYATLNTGTVNRALSKADLNVPDGDTTGACGLHAAEMMGRAPDPSNENNRDAFFAQLSNPMMASARVPKGLFSYASPEEIFANPTGDFSPMLSAGRQMAMNASPILASASTGMDGDPLGRASIFHSSLGDGSENQLAPTALSSSRPHVGFDFIPANGMLAVEL